MSGSGNMIPQSMSRIRPSTSTQAQLRPISPSPPRNTTRTGLVTPSEGSSRSAPPGWPVGQEQPSGRPGRGAGRDDDAVAPPDPAPVHTLAGDPADRAAHHRERRQGPPQEAEQRGRHQQAAVLPPGDDDAGGDGDVDHEAEEQDSGGE